jgi:hypothetical protein
MKQLYLIYSSDAKWVTRRREALIDELMPREMHDQNLLEIFSTSSRSVVELGAVLPEIISEMATIPFLPDNRRVVVVHNVADAFRGEAASKTASKNAKKTAKKPTKKKQDETDAPRRFSPVETLAAFVNVDLPATQNVLIFSNIIEYDRGQEIDEKGPFHRLIENSPLGEIIKPDHRETNPLFLMSDALLCRDAVGSLRHLRSVYRDDARGRVFNEILRNVRFLVQAKVVSLLERKGTSREVIETKYLPDDKRLNFYQQSPFVQKKIKEHLEDFNLRELMRALERLLEINRGLYPTKDAAYVPDVRMLLETFLVEFCEGALAR